MPELQKIVDDLISGRLLVSGVIHSPRNKQVKYRKVSIRPVLIKDSILYQFTYFDGKQAFDQNIQPTEAKSALLALLQNEYKQGLLSTDKEEYHILVSKSGQATILKKRQSQPQTNPLSLEHNRKKKYLLEEGSPIPFLVELGIMNPQGKVFAAKYDKFRQINRFVEMIDDVLPYLDRNKTLQIIDFGCGKSYLTFALYHYFTEIQGYKINVVGLDLKKDVIDFCNGISKKLNYKDLRFQVGDIGHYQTQASIDLVVSLHACDTATDAALEKAIKWGAKVILAVPCCQHELFEQMQNTPLSPMLKFGILKERFTGLATDALRALILETLGYKTHILEFIDMEHTPKNLLIRAVKQDKVPSPKEKSKHLQEYRQLKALLNVEPSLERGFQKELEETS